MKTKLSKLLLALTVVFLISCSASGISSSPLRLTSGGRTIAYGMTREEIESQIGSAGEEDGNCVQYGDIQVFYRDDAAVELRVTNYGGGADAWETGGGVKVGMPVAEALSAYGLAPLGNSLSVVIPFINEGDGLKMATDEELEAVDVYDVFCIYLFLIGDTVAEIRMYDMKSFLADATVSSICPM